MHTHTHVYTRTRSHDSNMGGNTTDCISPRQSTLTGTSHHHLTVKYRKSGQVLLFVLSDYIKTRIIPDYFILTSASRDKEEPNHN